MQKSLKITETLANGYSSKSTQRDLPNEYQHDRVSMVFKRFCILVHWTKVALALEGLRNGHFCVWMGHPVHHGHCLLTSTLANGSNF